MLSSTAPVVAVHLAGPGSGSTAALRLPPDALPPGARLSALRIAVSPGPGRAEGLAAGVRLVAAEVESGARPLVLASGTPAALLALAGALREAGLASVARLVLCIASADRPFLPEPGARLPFLHGIVVDAPPTAAEARCWSDAFGEAIAARVCTVPAALPTAVSPPDTGTQAALRRRSGVGEDDFVVSQLAARDDGRVAQGVLAFAVWAGGRYARCATCRALSRDRLLASTGRHEERAACLYCGSRALRRGTPRPEARLALARLEPGEGAPDPEVVARWLGVEAQVVRVPEDRAGAGALEAGIAMADAVLVLGHAAFADPILDLARRSGRPCVSQAPVPAGADPDLAVASAHYSWDRRGGVTAHPALTPLVRALDAAWASREDVTGAVSPAGDDASRVEALRRGWRAAVETLAARPRRPPRRWPAGAGPGW